MKFEDFVLLVVLLPAEQCADDEFDESGCQS